MDYEGYIERLISIWNDTYESRREELEVYSTRRKRRYPPLHPLFRIVNPVDKTPQGKYEGRALL
jgi:hypothetical protein